MLRTCLALCLVTATFPLRAQQADSGEQPLPAPRWVEMFDQGEADPRLKGYRTPRGIKLELAAQQPAVVNPRLLAFGDDGTPYVIEWRPGELREDTQRTTKSTRDVLKSLHDTNGDGVFDEARVVMDDLELPSGLLIDNGWFYWTSWGRILRRRPFDATLSEQLAAAAAEKRGPPTTVTSDGKWLEQLLVSGLSAVIHFQAGGLSLGQGGWLYVACGTRGNRARSWDGSQAAVLRSGAVFRLRPDGSQVHEFARGFYQPRGCLAFDPLGNCFLAEADWTVEKGAGGRLIHVLEGGNYGWQQDGAVRAVVWGERAGTLPGMLRGASSAGMSLANFAGGLLISADVDGHAVRAFATQADDATQRAMSQFALLQSDDPLFRPCQAVTGPDGALYVVDWQSSGVFSAATGDNRQGRIYRLIWSGWKDMPAVPLAPRDRWSRLAADSDEQLLAHLEASDAELRRRAGQEIAARAHKDPAQAAKFRPRLGALAADESKSIAVRATAIAAAGQLVDKPLREALGELLAHKDADLVRLAAEALGNSPPAQEEELAAVGENFKGALSATADPAKLRALALGLGKLAAAGKSIELAEWNFEGTSVTHGPKMSRYVFDGHARALELVPGAAKELMLGNLDVALNLPEAEPAERQRLKEFVTLTAEAMRTRELSEFLDALLLAEENWFVRLPAPLESRLLACYRNVVVDPPINADAVATWLDKNPGGPAEVEVAALETLSLVGTTKEGYVEKLADRLLAKPAEAALVGRSFAAGRLDRKLLPRIKEALARHAAGDGTGDAAAVLKQLEK